ncbi:MAG: right-handed parallel beta-helix repeat-containing protein [Lachnospiraceae bacterium]
MKIYVSKQGTKDSNGTIEKPFCTITEAANIARAGDEVIVSEGVYRECVNPINGGTGEDKRITYRSEVCGAAIISGAEIAKEWKHYQNEVWVIHICNSVFGDYNPYTTPVKGDWYFATKLFHTGELYLNGKAMYETQSIEEVIEATASNKAWDAEFSTYKWFTKQEENETVIYANFHGANPNQELVEYNVRRNCFYPHKTGVNYITLSGFAIKQAATQWAPPTAYQEGMVGPHWSKGWIIENCEISDSRCSGISLGKYLQPNNENKWSTKITKHGTQTERDAICQAYNEGWSKGKIGSHIVRNCDIHDCGQTGIVGHLGGVFSLIEENHIHHINNKQDLFGAEIAGIKMHAAIDVVLRKNHIHHCTRGLWLDWQAQGTRVTSNFFHDNIPPQGRTLDFAYEIGEDLFVEVSHGPTLIDHNVLLSPCSLRLSTQGIAVVHNLIAGAFTAVGIGVDADTKPHPTPRYTPYHVPHSTEIAGFMSILHGDARFYNNIFIQQEVRPDIKEFIEKSDAQGGKEFMATPNFICGTKPYDQYPTKEEYFGGFGAVGNLGFNNLEKYYAHLPVYTGGNLYMNNAEPCDKEKDFQIEQNHKIELLLKEQNHTYTLETNAYAYVLEYEKQMISTEILGEAFEPEQPFDNPDGSKIVFDVDYFGKPRESNPQVGPFEIHSKKKEILELI